MGLLDSLQNGLFGDPNDPQAAARSQGLLSLAAGLLKPTPGGNFGQALSNGLLQGLQGYQEANHAGQAGQFNQMRIAQMKEAADRQKQINALPGQFMRSPEQMALSNGQGPTNANAAAIPSTQGSFDYSGYSDALAGIDPQAALGIKALLKKEAPKYGHPQQIIGPDGKPRIALVGEDGSIKDTGATPYVKPDVHNFGNYIGGIDPTTGRVTNFGNVGVSPNAMLSANTQLQTAGMKAASDSGMGKMPSGYRMSPDGQSMEPIPGGPADTKLKGKFDADSAALSGTTSSFDRLAAAANEVLNHPGLDGIFGVKGMLPNFPGGEAANAKALIDTLKSQIGFSVLQDMRNNSKTGGALGAVSDKENQMLQSNLAALDKAQSVEQAKASLQKIIDYSNGAKERMQNAFNTHYQNGASGGAQPTQKTVVRTGMLNGRKVVQYSDGTTAYQP